MECFFGNPDRRTVSYVPGDVIGRGEVVWEMGMVGVTEGSGSVEVCANYTQAVEGFTVETSTTEVFASKSVTIVFFTVYFKSSTVTIVL